MSGRGGSFEEWSRLVGGGGCNPVVTQSPQPAGLELMMMTGLVSRIWSCLFNMAVSDPPIRFRFRCNPIKFQSGIPPLLVVMQHSDVYMACCCDWVGRLRALIFVRPLCVGVGVLESI